MIIKINDERGFEQSTLYFGYLEENNSTTIEFELPEYLEKYNKKLNFLLHDGTTVCKLFNDINSNKFTFTRDLLKFNKLQMAIEFFDTNEDLIYRTSILTIRISDSIICDDDVTEDDPKVVILDELIQKVNELNTEITENEATRESNEQTRISNEETRAVNETAREEYVTQLKKDIELGNLDGATFTPSVSENGDLSWTNNKGLENPTTVNIKGEKGDKGQKGDKGDTGVGISKLEVIDGALYVTLTNNVKENAGVILTDEVKAWLVSQITDNAESDFNTYYNSKVEEFNTNATSKINEYDTNANEKLEEYNTNATNKINEYNTNAEAILKILPKTETEVLEEIDIDDAGESSFNELKLFGNSRQESTTGAQLLEITNTDLNDGDLKVVNDNGILKITGTPSDVNYNRTLYVFNCKEEGQYYIEDNVSRNDEKIKIIYTINDNLWVNSNQQHVLNLQAGDIVKINLRIDTAENYNDTIKPMLNKGKTKLEWEPYTGGKPSPNPDYPQEIESIKDSINFKRIGKNYFNSEIEMGGYTAGGTKYASNTRIRSVNSFILKPDTYTISCPTATAIAINSAYGNKEQTIYDNNVLTITLEEEQDCILTVEIPDLLNAKIQIEKGTEATEYEPYHEDEYTINLNTDLNSINILSKQLEYNYVDEDGNKYLCDIIDFKNKKIIKYLNKIILPKENITWNQNKDETDFFEIANFYILNQYQARGDLAISNYFRDYRYKSNYLVANLGTIYIRFPKSSGIDTLQKAQEFMDTHDVEVLYVLAKPKEIDLTDEELSYLEQFPLQKGINHIYSDDELSPKFQLKYYQDINILLDKINKNIADVSAQLI